MVGLSGILSQVSNSSTFIPLHLETLCMWEIPKFGGGHSPLIYMCITAYAMLHITTTNTYAMTIFSGGVRLWAIAPPCNETLYPSLGLVTHFAISSVLLGRQDWKKAMHLQRLRTGEFTYLTHRQYGHVSTEESATPYTQNKILTSMMVT